MTIAITIDEILKFSVDSISKNYPNLDKNVIFDSVIRLLTFYFSDEQNKTKRNAGVLFLEEIKTKEELRVELENILKLDV